MANEKHVTLLKQGEVVWNQWRKDNPTIRPDFQRAELQGAQLENCDLHGADFRRAELQGAQLMNCDLHGADIRKARLAWSNLHGADLTGSDLRGVKLNDARAPCANFTNCKLQENSYLWGSDFRDAVFRGANLSQANLMCTQLIRADFSCADLSGCKVYGASVWEVNLEGATQKQLVITPPNTPHEAVIMAEGLLVAQFLFLLSDRSQMRRLLHALSDKAVLILGRFGGGGLAVLEAAADSLRVMGYLPLIFDFPRERSRNYTETIQTLVGLSRFVIVDLSGPSVPQELYATVPHFKVPFVPIHQKHERSFSLFADLLEYPWVLGPIVEFTDTSSLEARLEEDVVARAEERIAERERRLGKLLGEVD